MLTTGATSHPTSQRKTQVPQGVLRKICIRGGIERQEVNIQPKDENRRIAD